MKGHPEFLTSYRRALAGESFADVSTRDGLIYERWLEITRASR